MSNDVISKIVNKIDITQEQKDIFLKWIHIENYNINELQKGITKKQMYIKALIESKICTSIYEAEKIWLEYEQEERLSIILSDLNSPYLNVEKLHDVFPFFYDRTGLFWFWNHLEYCWQIKDETDLKILVGKVFQNKTAFVSSKISTEYINAIEMVGRERMPKQPDKNWIQFKNKIFDLNTKKIIDATPEYFICNPIPHNIGSSSETPVIDKLFSQWVGEEWKETLYEIIAYCCLTDYPIHIMVGLNGTGRNGKSKFLKLLENFIGRVNCCSTELDDLVGNRFESSKLYKKLVCTMGETNFDVLRNTSRLKKLTGQDLVGFEFKNKTPFDDINYAKIIISSNSFPDTDDTSDGFYRRWMIVQFPNEFSEGKDILNEIPEYEYDNLCNKICNILPKLLDRGTFSNQGTINERKQRYIMASNPLPDFIERCCIKGNDLFCLQSELKHSYTQYLIKNKKRVINWNNFKDALEREGFFVERTTKTIDNKYISSRFVIGLKLKNNWQDVMTVMPVMTPFQLSLLCTRDEYESVSQVSQLSQNLTDSDILKLFRDNSDKNKEIEATESTLSGLKRLTFKGEIFEVRPGVYRLLE